MTISINGTNGLIQAYDYQVLTTGFTYTFAAGTQVLVINPAGTLATGTITMPAAPSDGMTITVESTQEVTALTLNGNTGQTVTGKPVQLIPNQPLSWVYRSTGTTWYPFSGGAGRATALVSGTSQASTSGTSIDFTGIPSWVKRVTVMFSGVSTNGSGTIWLQTGSGSIVTTGYSSMSLTANSSGAAAGSSTSSAILVNLTGSATSTSYGTFVLTLLNSATNLWVANGSTADTTNTRTTSTQGGSTLSGALDRIRITTSTGTDTFDAGSINILYE